MANAVRHHWLWPLFRPLKRLIPVLQPQSIRKGLLGSGFVLGAGAGLLVGSEEAIAAERFIVTFGPLTRSFSVQDLKTFSETGEQSPNIRFFLNLTNQDPETVRQVLGEEVAMNLITVDRITYSLPGEFALYEIGRRFHTRSRRANIQALRAALILSASDDNRVSLIEFLENYPTEALYMDGVQVLDDVREVGEIIAVVNERIVPYVIAAQEFLEGLICECETPNSEDSEGLEDSEPSF